VRLRLYTDGASRGNPGPAGIGFVLVRPDDGQVVAEEGACLGRATNNEAEYRALAAGLARALALGAEAVEVCSDSELLVRQLTGRYRVREPRLQALAEEVRRLLAALPGGFEIRHVPREQNRRADALANRALDAGRRAPG
jgi:ribonuclease HI